LSAHVRSPGLEGIDRAGAVTEIYQIEADFKGKVASAFEEMIAPAGGVRPALFA